MSTKRASGSRPARGPWSSGYQPSRDNYKCPVEKCKSQNIRGDDISKHFESQGNLLVLDKANEHQSELKKRFSASDAVTVPDEFLKNQLISESEKSHTLYLFQNGFSSTKLPNYNSIGFKCQQNKNPNPISNWFGKPGKVIRLSDNVGNQNVDTIPMEIDLVPTDIASNSRDVSRAIVILIKLKSILSILNQKYQISRTKKIFIMAFVIN